MVTAEHRGVRRGGAGHGRRLPTYGQVVVGLGAAIFGAIFNATVQPAATDHVYAGLALAALATIIVILVIIPRQLAITAAAPSGHASPGDAADGAIGDSPT